VKTRRGKGKDELAWVGAAGAGQRSRALPTAGYESAPKGMRCARYCYGPCLSWCRCGRFMACGVMEAFENGTTFAPSVHVGANLNEDHDPRAGERGRRAGTGGCSLHAPALMGARHRCSVLSTAGDRLAPPPDADPTAWLLFPAADGAAHSSFSSERARIRRRALRGRAPRRKTGRK